VAEQGAVLAVARGDAPHRRDRVHHHEQEYRNRDCGDQHRIGATEEVDAFEEARDVVHRVLAEQDAGDQQHVHPHEEHQDEAARALDDIDPRRHAVEARGCAVT
jgi:hypothetical protein